MNKKLLLFSAVALAFAPRGNAEFFVGVRIDGGLRQVKIYDGTTHKGTSVTHTFAAGSVYSGADVEGTYTIPVPNMSRSDSPTALTSDYLFKVYPSGAIFLGYDHRLGPNLFVGLEISGGAQFRSTKLDLYAKTPEMKHLEAKGTVVSEKTTSPVTDELLYNVEMKTKFSGEASLRAGYVFPGTDGRIALVLFGGVGLVNREISASLKGSGEHYTMVVIDGFYRNGETLWVNSPKVNELGGSAATQKARYAYMAMSDPAYFAYKLSGQGFAKNHYVVEDVAATGDAPAPEVLAQAKVDSGIEAAHRVIWDILANGKTGSKLIIPAAIADFQESTTKTKFSWHVGANLECKLGNGVFVRVGYTLVYVKGLNVEKNVTVLSPDKKTLIAAFHKEIDDGALDAVVDQATFSHKTDAKITDADIRPGVNKQSLKNVITEDFGDLPDNRFNLGDVNFKVGDNEKHFDHRFSLSLGIKFGGR